jgi:HAD superfamily hydrolase (TIGR01450 family)
MAAATHPDPLPIARGDAEREYHAISTPIIIIDGIADLAATSDAWLVDVWGVMHDGKTPFPEAVAACRAFRASGGTVLLLSNSPRTSERVAQQLDGIGVPRESYDAILSSGELTRAALKERAEFPSPVDAKHRSATTRGGVRGGGAKDTGSAHISTRTRIHHIGPERDRPTFDALAVEFASVDAAEIAVCTGLLDDETETPDDYRATLQALLARGLPMICANPDKRVERGNKMIPCAGAVAELYESLGGVVTWFGKPYAEAYAGARRLVASLRGGEVPLGRLLAIGDGADTDIKGAFDAGIRSVYIASAVSLGKGVALSQASLDALFAPRPHKPIAAMTGLRW